MPVIQLIAELMMPVGRLRYLNNDFEFIFSPAAYAILDKPEVQIRGRQVQIGNLKRQLKNLEQVSV